MARVGKEMRRNKGGGGGVMEESKMGGRPPHAARVQVFMQKTQKRTVGAKLLRDLNAL